MSTRSSRATSPTIASANTISRGKKISAPSLFPPIPTADPSPPEPAELAPNDSGRVGIARLAASSPLSEEKRGTEYFLLPVRSILNRCNSPRVPFEWTINPYRGCEFGCRYCYARYTHEYMELDPLDFEHKIYAKQNAGDLLSRDLAQHFQAPTSSLLPPEHIAIGTATDPYQPAERDFGVTRAILTEFARREGLSLSITTKSSQVVRDLDLLRQIAARSTLTINMTVTTIRPRLARLLEPRAPRPDLRLAAVRQLRDAGIAVGVFAMPVLPGLTDREHDLDALAGAAAEAGAQWLGGQVLFLMPSSMKVFLPFLDEKFPKLARRYRDWYTRSAYAPESYRKEIAALFARIRARHGLRSRPYAPDAVAKSLEVAQPQLPLDFAACASTSQAIPAPCIAPMAPVRRTNPTRTAA